ncbi:MAG TPA: hypothetical protein EYG38_10885 [Verrucomicrobia bacterium]|nr:hypothetical protein [Verrucomicrobiota bacterium]
MSIEWVFGVSKDGIYLSPESNLQLDLQFTESRTTGGYSLPGEYEVSLTGEIKPENEAVSVTLDLPNSNERAFFASDMEIDWRANLEGSLDITLGFELNPLPLTWAGVWTLRGNGDQIEVTPQINFPSQGELIAASLKLVHDQFKTVFSGGLSSWLNQIPIPLADAGQLKGLISGNPNSGTEQIDGIRCFEDLMGFIRSRVDWSGVARTDGGFGSLGLGKSYTVGDLLMGAFVLRDQFNVNGGALDLPDEDVRPVRIGLISDGIAGLETAIASKDIPKGQLHKNSELLGGPIQSQVGSSGAEGTAMMEIIFDLAPGVEIYFAGVGGASRFNGDHAETRFLAGVGWFLENNVDIIVDDIGFSGDGLSFLDADVSPQGDPENGRFVTQIQSLILDDEILFITAGGNDAHKILADNFNPVLKNENSYHHRFSDGSEFVSIEVPAKQTL